MPTPIQCSLRHHHAAHQPEAGISCTPSLGTTSGRPSLLRCVSPSPQNSQVPNSSVPGTRTSHSVASRGPSPPGRAHLRFWTRMRDPVPSTVPVTGESPFPHSSRRWCPSPAAAIQQWPPGRIRPEVLVAGTRFDPPPLHDEPPYDLSQPEPRPHPPGDVAVGSGETRETPPPGTSPSGAKNTFEALRHLLWDQRRAVNHQRRRIKQPIPEPLPVSWGMSEGALCAHGRSLNLTAMSKRFDSVSWPSHGMSLFQLSRFRSHDTARRPRRLHEQPLDRGRHTGTGRAAGCSLISNRSKKRGTP
jgi:hypothetical protein